MRKSLLPLVTTPRPLDHRIVTDLRGESDYFYIGRVKDAATREVFDDLIRSVDMQLEYQRRSSR